MYVGVPNATVVFLPSETNFASPKSRSRTIGDIP